MGQTITGDGIVLYADNTAMRAIATEILTGMQLTRTHTGIQALQVRGLIAGRTTKENAIEQAAKAMAEKWEGWEPNGSIQRALDKAKADKLARKQARKASK